MEKNVLNIFYEIKSKALLFIDFYKILKLKIDVTKKLKKILVIKINLV